MGELLQAIIGAYERTKDAPNTSIPTPLMLAIEHAKAVQHGASPFVERRGTTRPDHDLDTFGRPITPGT